MPGLDRDRRRARIVELIGSQPVQSQNALQELLAEEGCPVNQATLSRDLRDLGVVKARDGYHLPRVPLVDDAEERLEQAISLWLLSALPAENQLVLRTPPGGAQALALAIDQAGLPEVLGTLAGDDTVLVITPDRRTARRLATTFQIDSATR